MITGASGFIGANLCRELRHLGVDVHILVRPGSDLWRLRSILPDLTIHRADLLDRQVLSRQARAIRPDYIYHLAAERGEDSPLARETALRVNLLGLFNLLEATRNLGFRAFVSGGGSLEYGPTALPHRETNPPAPRLFYGFTKAAATLLAQQFSRSTGLNVVTLRFFSVYGYWEAPGRLIPTAIRAALQGGSLSLTRPNIRHDLIFVEDVVEACLLAARVRGVSGRIFNVGTGREWTNQQVVAMIEEITGRSIHKRRGRFPERPADTSHWRADIRTVRRELGWKPRHTLSAGLTKTVAWFLSHGDKYGLSR